MHYIVKHYTKLQFDRCNWMQIWPVQLGNIFIMRLRMHVTCWTSKSALRHQSKFNKDFYSSEISIATDVGPLNKYCNTCFVFAMFLYFLSMDTTYIWDCPALQRMYFLDTHICFLWPFQRYHGLLYKYKKNLFSSFTLFIHLVFGRTVERWTIWTHWIRLLCVTRIHLELGSFWKYDHIASLYWAVAQQ